MYDSNTSTVTAALTISNPAVFTSETVNQILELTTTAGTDTVVKFEQVVAPADGVVTVPAGTDVVIIASSDTVQTTITPPKNAPVLIFEGKGGVNVTLNDGVTAGAAGDAQGATSEGTERVVIGSSGNDNFVISDAKDTLLTLGSGNSTVVTGKGIDTVVAGMGNATITGGNSDYSVVKLNALASLFSVTATNGHAVVKNIASGQVTDITKIQYVEVNGDDALIFANNNVEASIATLYETAFGRTADAAGLDHWFDLAKSGATLKQIADSLVTSAEFAPRAAMTDTAFINSLYQSTFGRAGEEAGINYWLGAMHNQGATRADLVRSFAMVHTLNVAKDEQALASDLEATLVGNVTIVTGII